MKIFMMVLMTAMALILTGCCSGKCDAKQKCPGKRQCARACAKQKKCPFLGKWQFYVVQGDKLAALPVDPQPQLELQPRGVMLFRYAKNDRPAVLEGRWKIDGDALVISNMDGTNVQRYILQPDNSAVYTVGANDKLPAKTKVVIKKIK